MNTFIRLLYALLIAGAVVAFIAGALYTFYPSPQSPSYPMTLDQGKMTAINQPLGSPTSDAEELYQRQLADYQENIKTYQRNASIILVGVAIGLVAIGLWLRGRSDIIGEGLALGGIGNSIYAVGMATAGEDRVMRFVAVTVFLASVLVLVYVKFKGVPAEPKPNTKRR